MSAGRSRQAPHSANKLQTTGTKEPRTDFGETTGRMRPEQVNSDLTI